MCTFLVAHFFGPMGDFLSCVFDAVLVFAHWPFVYPLTSPLTLLFSMYFFSCLIFKFELVFCMSIFPGREVKIFSSIMNISKPASTQSPLFIDGCPTSGSATEWIFVTEYLKHTAKKAPLFLGYNIRSLGNWSLTLVTMQCYHLKGSKWPENLTICKCSEHKQFHTCNKNIYEHLSVLQIRLRVNLTE